MLKINIGQKHFFALPIIIDNKIFFFNFNYLIYQISATLYLFYIIFSYCKYQTKIMNFFIILLFITYYFISELQGISLYSLKNIFQYWKSFCHLRYLI